MTALVSIRPVLETPRLRLEPVARQHLPVYLAYYLIPNDQKGSYRAPRPAAETEGLLTRDIAEWQRNGFGMFVLRVLDTGETVGGTGLAHLSDWPRHELTWWLMPNAQGNGYATEASRAVLLWAYDTLGWSMVETHMRDENLSARRLAERLGGRKIARETFPDDITRDVYALPHPEAHTA